MNVEIQRDPNIDISDIIRRSPIVDDPNAPDILHKFVTHSDEVWVGSVNSEAACVFGLICPSVLSDTAYLWLLTTDTAEEHTFLLVRHSQLWIQRTLKRYTAIRGHVDRRNHKAIRWLKWLGAEIASPNGSTREFFIRAE